MATVSFKADILPLFTKTDEFAGAVAIFWENGMTGPERPNGAGNTGPDEAGSA